MEIRFSHINYVRLIFPFLLGTIVGIYTNLPLFIPYYIGFSVLGFVSIVIVFKLLPPLFLRWRFAFGVAMYFYLAGISFLLVQSVKNKNQSTYFEHQINHSSWMKVQLDSDVEEKKQSIKVSGKVKQIITHEKAIATAGNILIYFEKSAAENLNFGDILLIPAHKIKAIEEPQNPDEFDYRQFLGFKQIYHQIYLKKNDFIFISKNEGNKVLQLAISSRKYLLNQLFAHLNSNETKAIAGSLILGVRNYLDAELKKNYSSAGAMHVLAVSGLHVGILFLVVDKLLFFMNRSRKSQWAKSIIILLLIWAYALLTGFSPSVQRAAIMFSFINFGKLSKRGYNIYNVLAAAALLHLLIHPFAIMEVGFQLSYLAVLGIVMFQDFFYQLIDIKNRWLDYFWQITCVSFAAQLITFPIGLLYFHQFPTFFFVSNIFVIPLAFIIMFLGLLLLLVHPLEGLSNGIGKVLNFFIDIMNQIVAIVESLPNSLIQGLSISIWEAWLIYTLIFCGFLLIHFRNAKIILSALFLMLMILSYNVVENYYQYRQKQIVIYSVPNYYAVDFIDGKSNLLLASPALLQDFDKMQFHIYHYWWANDICINAKSHFTPSLNLKEGTHFIQQRNFFQFYNQKICWLNDMPLPNVANTKIKIDFLLLNHNVKYSLSKILNYFDASMIIADGTCKFYQINNWQQEALQIQAPLHICKNKGAAIFKI